MLTLPCCGSQCQLHSCPLPPFSASACKILTRIPFGETSETISDLRPESQKLHYFFINHLFIRPLRKIWLTCVASTLWFSVNSTSTLWLICWASLRAFLPSLWMVGVFPKSILVTVLLILIASAIATAPSSLIIVLDKWISCTVLLILMASASATAPTSPM